MALNSSMEIFTTLGKEKAFSRGAHRNMWEKKTPDGKSGDPMGNKSVQNNFDLEVIDSNNYSILIQCLTLS